MSLSYLDPFLYYFGSSINPSIAWSRGKHGEGRFRITFPLDSTWYKEQKYTRFQSLQHRKESRGRFRHEFIVLELTNGWICRIERVGDPDASFHAIGAKGIEAHDVIQSFSPEKLSEACLKTSDVVVEIKFPCELDLKIVFLICRAMQEGEKTCNYTLQVFNCYFFALTIQAALTRFVADWRHSLWEETWDSALKRGLSDLSDFYKAVASDRDQQPFILRLYSVFRPDTRWPAEDLMDNLKQQLYQLTDVSRFCNATLWYTDTGLAIERELRRRVRDVAVGILKANSQSGDLLVEIISRAISAHEQELQTSRLGRIQLGTEQKGQLIQEFQSFLSGLHSAEDWTLDYRPSNPHPRPDPPQSPPDLSQPHPDSPHPRPDSSQPRPDSPQPRPDSSQPHPSSPEIHPYPSRPDPDPPKPHLDLPQLRPDSPQPHPSQSHPDSHPDPPEPQLDPPRSTPRSILSKVPQVPVWLTYARTLALWAFRVVLRFFWTHLPGSTRPAPCVFIEDELGSNPGIGHGSVDEFTSISRKLHSLIDTPQLVVQWKEWPWDHIYQEIKQHIPESPAIETGELQVSRISISQSMTVSEFQKHLRKRIRDHAEHVESWRLGSAAGIHIEMEDRISQVWALVRRDDIIPTPAEVASATEIEAKASEMAETMAVEPESEDVSKAQDHAEHVVGSSELGSAASVQDEMENKSQGYEPLLPKNEREAVADLLLFLQNRTTTNFFSGSPLSTLTILSFSENVDLQRSAALAFAEITEKEVRQVGRDTLDPILFLLSSHDTEVQRAASAALGNLAVNTENKILIVKLGGLEPLIRQMLSPNVEVQCNAVGCVTNLATHDENKTTIAKSGALIPLIRLARSKDMRVQRNATGALLNMTHSDENRQQLVDAGAIPVLVGLLNSPDTDVQYYCVTALSNIATDAGDRKKLASSEPKLVQNLVALMDSPGLKVQCQAALALRNLASDEKYQPEIVQADGLQPLLRLLQSTYLPLILSSAACVRNLSIHPLNETPIIEAGYLGPLVGLLSFEENEEVQCHAISTLRNLAASSEKNKGQIIAAGAVHTIKELVLSVPVNVQSEMTACVAVLALSDELKPQLLELGICEVLIPLTNSPSTEVQGNSAAALGNLSSKDERSSLDDYSAFNDVWDKPEGGLHTYLFRFLSSPDATFQHIAVWTIVQLLESRDPQLTHNIRSSPLLIPHIRHLSASTASSSSSSPGSQSPTSSDDAGEGSQSEIAALARRILEFTDGDGPEEGVSMSAGEGERGEEELRKSVREAFRVRQD